MYKWIWCQDMCIIFISYYILVYEYRLRFVIKYVEKKFLEVRFNLGILLWYTWFMVTTILSSTRALSASRMSTHHNRLLGSILHWIPLFTHHNANKNYLSLFYLILINISMITAHGTDLHHKMYHKCMETHSVD